MLLGCHLLRVIGAEAEFPSAGWVTIHLGAGAAGLSRIRRPLTSQDARLREVLFRMTTQGVELLVVELATFGD